MVPIADLRKNSKGFTLPELLVVMVILALLAAVSTPFIKGYIRDAQNGKAKAALIQIAEAYKTFRTDYPNATVSGTVTKESRAASDCGESTIQYKGNNEANVLVSCKYLRPIKWSRMKYTFSVGGSCSACSGTVHASMQGTDSGGDYSSSYCACVDEYGNIKDNKSAD